MLSREDNERLTRVGPGTPMGELMRRYWIPAAFSHQIAKPDWPPVRVKLMGERLVAFRDTQGRVGLLDERCPHRTASLFFGRNEECGLRCVYHGWKFDIDGNCVDLPSEPQRQQAPERTRQGQGLSLPRARRRGVDLYGAARAQAGVSRSRMDAHSAVAALRSRATSRNATGCRGSKAASTPATCRSCTAAPPREHAASSCRRATRWCRPISASSSAPAASRRGRRRCGPRT